MQILKLIILIGFIIIWKSIEIDGEDILVLFLFFITIRLQFNWSILSISFQLSLYFFQLLK